MNFELKEFSIIPEKMDDWEKGLENNRDPYGRACFVYASKWANLMENKMREGGKLQDIAEKTAREADTEGITGFMYGIAVSILSQVWIHGEELRVWHNKQYEV